MPRRHRFADGAYVYHVLNRAVGRATLCAKPGDYAAFEAGEPGGAGGTVALVEPVAPHASHACALAERRSAAAVRDLDRTRQRDRDGSGAAAIPTQTFDLGSVLGRQSDHQFSSRSQN